MAEGKKFSQRMSDSDALMWNIEKDPALRSTITAISILDRAPDRDRVQAKLERGTRLIERLRQRPVSSPFAVAPPRWMVDPNFDLSFHMRWLGCPGNGTMRDLLDLAAPMAMRGFDRARPLWETVIVEGLEDGRAAMIQKVHHAVTDGVGGVEIALMLLDTDRDAPADADMPAAPEPEHLSSQDLITDGLAHEGRRMLGIARRTIEGAPGVITNPQQTAATLVDTVQSAVRMMAPTPTPLSPIMTGRSLSVRFDILSASLSDMKRAAKKADGRLNDALLAAVAGGFRRYHEAHGVACEAVRISMPISLREAGSESLGGNEFAPARFPLPIMIDDPIERMAAVRAIVAEQRGEPALRLANGIAGILNRFPTTMVTGLFGGMLKTVDCVVSNVPGVPFEVFLCGGRVDAQYAMGPLAGAAVNITLLSHLDDIHLGIVTDKAGVPDAELLVECLEDGIKEILKLA